MLGVSLFSCSSDDEDDDEPIDQTVTSYQYTSNISFKDTVDFNNNSSMSSITLIGDPAIITNGDTKEALLELYIDGNVVESKTVTLMSGDDASDALVFVINGNDYVKGSRNITFTVSVGGLTESSSSVTLSTESISEDNSVDINFVTNPSITATVDDNNDGFITGFTVDFDAYINNGESVSKEVYAEVGFSTGGSIMKVFTSSNFTITGNTTNDAQSLTVSSSDIAAISSSQFEYLVQAYNVGITLKEASTNEEIKYMGASTGNLVFESFNSDNRSYTFGTVSYDQTNDYDLDGSYSNIRFNVPVVLNNGEDYNTYKGIIEYREAGTTGEYISYRQSENELYGASGTLQFTVEGYKINGGVAGTYDFRVVIVEGEKNNKNTEIISFEFGAGVQSEKLKRIISVDGSNSGFLLNQKLEPIGEDNNA